jgi:isoleucyl-tRNA synthetase
LEDVEIIAEDVAGWQVANLGNLTVALDVQITDDLKREGIARELINRIQNLRKDNGFEVTDRINVSLSQNSDLEKAVQNNLSYICTEILANSLVFKENLSSTDVIEIDEHTLEVLIEKI